MRVVFANQNINTIPLTVLPPVILTGRNAAGNIPVAPAHPAFLPEVSVATNTILTPVLRFVKEPKTITAINVLP